MHAALRVSDSADVSLPLIIYEFARSPYPEQQKLAWTGALIVTLAVLSPSIFARVISSSRSASR
jgi:phosphate transport system permease protein